jgi:Fic family protein
MSKIYSPPYNVTPAIISLIARISEHIGRISALDDVSKKLRLRRTNQIRTIQGSLAIEGNTLSIEQITAIMEGKRIIAPPREIIEVKNAIKAYDRIEKWNPFLEKDLLDAHRLLMSGLLDDAGKFRTRGVGVMAGEKIMHMAPPAKRVPDLMRDLMQWLKTTDQHPLISSSVFHYEFEFIHPFQDGNGRIGRIWQTLMLVKFNPLFIAIPVESLVYEHQADYYAAIGQSTKNGESTVFIEFMLNMILDSFKSLATPEVTPEVRKLLLAMNGEMSRRQLQQKLELKDEKHFREAYQQPAVAAGLIEMTVRDKPNSRMQKYRLTSKGAAIVNI